MSSQPVTRLFVAAAALALFAEAAQASGPYLTGGLTVTHVQTNGIQEGLVSEGFTASTELDDAAIGYQIGAGYMFTENFGVEVRYGDSGSGKDTILVSDGVISIPLSVEAEADGFTIYAVEQGSIADKWDLFAKLGITRQNGKFSVTGNGGSGSISDDDKGFAVAGGVRFRVAESWRITGEVEYFAVDFDGAIQDPLRGSINIQYLFGK